MLRRYARESLGIVLFSVCLALASNQVRSDALPLVRPKPAPPVVAAPDRHQGSAVSFQELTAKLNTPGVVVVDARASEEFSEGHIPGTRNIPYFAGPEQFTRFMQEVPLDVEVITYCEGVECSAAENLALQLRQLGYGKVNIFAGGWDEWTKHNMPVVRGLN
jgi:3-mercaptopyruvate sulfurtransferase SseA